MEIWATIVGIAVAVAVAAYLHVRKPAGMGRTMQLVAIAAAAALSAAATGFGLKYLESRDNASVVEQALQVVREAPLVGLVLKENATVEARFRQAIEAELKDPAKIGPQQTFIVGGEVRRDFIVPALRNADDASALGAIAAMHAFVKYLQGTNVVLCKEFGLVGIQQPNRLDGNGGALFRRALSAQEEAYLNGRARPAAAAAAQQQQQITSQEVIRLLTEAGFTTADFNTLAALAKASDADGCAITVKLYGAPALLPPQSGGILARYLLSIS
ncbi:MAG: hypothetical protein PSV46_00650 [Reyranella sp.]|nr:hypothetical protein [Reyranella sp.]